MSAEEEKAVQLIDNQNLDMYVPFNEYARIGNTKRKEPPPNEEKPKKKKRRRKRKRVKVTLKNFVNV